MEQGLFLRCAVEKKKNQRTKKTKKSAREKKKRQLTEQTPRGSAKLPPQGQRKACLSVLESTISKKRKNLRMGEKWKEGGQRKGSGRSKPVGG